jgi:hypothetical protein
MEFKMRKLSLILIFSAILSQFNSAQEYERKSLAVTIYNNNLGVIKDVRKIDIKSGTNKLEIRDVAQMIDPTSVKINLNGEVIEQNYQYDLVNLDKILQKYIDMDIQLIGENAELIEGKLLSSIGGQIVLQKKEGGLLMLPNVTKYRFNVNALPEGLITRPTLVCLLDSKNTGKQDVELTYQTGGMNWHAEYVAVLDKEDRMIDLNSWVSIENNSGTTYKDAKLKLVAGDVNMVKTQPQYRDGLIETMTMEKGANQFQEQPFFEYHIYNLQRPTTISQNETKQISLFEAKNVSIIKKYLFRSGGYYWNDGKNKVAVVVEYENSEKNNLGMPMPKGKVRMYKSDGQSLEFVGEDLIDHTPKNEKINLRIGDAFDIIAEEIQSDFKQITNKVSETTWQVTIKNKKSENIIVDYEKHIGLNWDVKNESLKYEKKDAQNILFKIQVEANKESTLIYTVRYSY